MAAPHRHANSAKTHCAKGHPYSIENTFWTKRANGAKWRQCRACRRAAVAKKRKLERGDW